MYAELTVWDEQRPVSRHRISPGKMFLLGRGPDAGIRIDDSAISRRHATFELSLNGLLTVQDLGSTNGTFLDGLRIEPKSSRPCLPGRTISAGKYDMTFELIGLEQPDQQDQTKRRILELLHLSEDEFDILGEIGRGAMGKVWAAYQKPEKRKVAIKMLRLEVGLQSEERQRFLREAELCQIIKSPYVIEVYEVRFARENPIIIMELVEGPSAAEHLKSQPFLLPEVLQIGEDVACALAAASLAGVVHRDVKPSNILVSPEGMAKLGDFGIAKKQEGTVKTRLTETGLGLGTLPYISPEQAINAKSADERSDIYSLGATLFHLIAGRPPFLVDNENLLQAVEQITQAEPPVLRSLRPDCPQPIADLVHRMLEKLPADRPQTPGEVAEELKKLRQSCYYDYELGETHGD